MNCQDVARLIDAGSFSAINATNRQDAAAHAQQCPRCAPLWFAHSRLAALPVYAMPPDLTRRCLALVASAGKVPAPRRTPRLVLVVSSLVALAAAASMIGVSLSGKMASHDDQRATRFFVSPASALRGASGEPSEAEEPALPAVTQAHAALPTRSEVPLFPPQDVAGQIFEARQRMALEKFVQLHPEVTQAAPAGMLYAGRILMRVDGKVLDHALRTVTPEALHWTRNDPNDGMPTDAGGSLGGYMPKGTQLEDGRSLGADLSLHQLFVRSSYDLGRSSLRVEEIVRTQRAQLMVPASEIGASHLTLLLSGSGAIQREVAGHVDAKALQEQQDWSVSQRAEAMARKLGVSKDEIGLMGRVIVSDKDTKRSVVVDYAWQRQAEESAAEFGQGGYSNPSDEGVDFATAVTLVERVMPQAFTEEEGVLQMIGVPTIILTEKGEFIRTARFIGSNPGRAFPGISFTSARLLQLKNGKGAEAGVYFIWQRTPPR